MKAVKVEKFTIVSCVGGFRTVPENLSHHPLLLRLHGDRPAEVSELIQLPLDELVQNLKDVCTQEKVLYDVVGDPAMPEFLLRDAAEAEAAEGISLTEALASRNIPVWALWQPDGRIQYQNTPVGKAKFQFDRDPAKSDAENIEAAADFVASHYPNPDKTYFNLADFLDKQDCDTAYEYGRALYKYTACGPWVTFELNRKDGVRQGLMDRATVYYEDDQAGQDAETQTWWADCHGISIGSIVEGSDVEVGPEYLGFPFTEEELDRVIQGIDNEADFYWKRDNCCYYSVRDKDGESIMYCQWVEFDDEPTGDFNEDDAESLALAVKAHAALWDGMRSFGAPKRIPIPGTDYFVQEEDTPDYVY